MRRKSILFSLPSLILLVILGSGLGLDLARNGGRAFSPGRLIAVRDPQSALGEYRSHSDFENECSLCHQPLKVRQGELCLECHKDISRQVQSGLGSHGKIVSVIECFECHSDHNGRDFNPIQEAMTKYDHSIASFSLKWHQVGYDALPMQCSSCHSSVSEFEFIPETCQDCHEGQDPEFMARHVSDFRQGCTTCHDGQDKMVDFDHQKAGFQLDGKHIEVRCAECHLILEFEKTPTNCIGCHSEPMIHENQFDPDCSACHNTEAWKPVLLDGKIFDHQNGTTFSLIRHHTGFNGETLNCRDCHNGEEYAVEPQVCLECHSNQEPEFMSMHTDLFGFSCLDCHDGVDRLSNFDHAVRFPLLGRHSEIDCEACHQEKVFRGIPEECFQCHAEPEIHAGFFGQKCQYCHIEKAWIPAQIQVHRFPMDHGNQGELACTVCHTDVYQSYTCFGCHEHNPENIEESHQDIDFSTVEFVDCSSCHVSGKVKDNDQ